MAFSRNTVFVVLVVFTSVVLLVFLVDVQLPFKSHVPTVIAPTPSASETKKHLPPPEAYSISADELLDENDTPITFVPYTFGFEMLLQTLQVYQRASWRNIVVLDNSWAKDAWVERDALKTFGVIKVVLTTAHLRFSQMMSTLDTLAMSLDLDYYLWTHSDVFLISPSSDPTPFDIVRSCITSHLTSTPKLGVLFFYYDWLSMVRVKAAAAVPWDPAVMQYGSDCDRYNRLRHADFVVTDASKSECPSLENLGHLENMRGTLSPADLTVVLSTEETYEKRLQTVTNAMNVTESYSWTVNGRGAMTALDVEAKYAAEIGGKWYWEKKWGTKWGEGGCEQKVEEKKFDVPSIEF